MQQNTTLFIIIRKQWFDAILHGDKREEYREIKDYWTERLEGRKYTHVKFQNGYAPNAPNFLIQYKGYRIGYAKKKWGGDSDEIFYCIKLGDLVK